MALACRQNGLGQVFAVDPHQVNDWTDVGVGSSTEAFLRDRVSRYDFDDWCTIMRMTSEEAARHWHRNIDLLFIDGDHSLEGVRRDFELFQPWLSPQALVVFHDTAWEHQQPWAEQEVAKLFPDMGVPEYMATLQDQGFQSVTLLPAPGLTIMAPRRGGFPFLGGRTDASTERQHAGIPQGDSNPHRGPTKA